METVRVMEAFHNLFYSTLYVTQNLGFFQDGGITVELETMGVDRSSVEALKTGEAHVALTGPMRSFVAADAGDRDAPVSFAEVNSRDGFILLSRRPIHRFQWQDLLGRIVLTYARPPTPWMCLLRVLKNHGVPPSGVTLMTHLLVPEAVEAFKGGLGDFIELPEPTAQELIAGGVAHLATPMGRAVGPIPYSSFAATRDFLSARQDTVLRFTRAVYRAQRWMDRHSGEEIATTVAPGFPKVRRDDLVSAVARYKAQNTWAADPLLRREGFHYLQEILREGGLIKNTHRYEDLVTTEFAETVMREAAASA